MSGSSPSAGRGSLSAPPLDALALRFGLADLGRMRSVVAEQAQLPGIDPARAEDLVLAVSELASNSIRHAGGGGELRVWTTTDRLVREVSDSGQISGPAVGRVRPDLDGGGGVGLWLVNQLCDQVEIRSSSAGTTVRVQMWRGSAKGALSP